MAIQFRCHNDACGRSLRIKDELAGKRIKCPGCGQRLQVPAGSALSTVSPGSWPVARPHVPPLSAIPRQAPVATTPRRSRPGVPALWLCCLALVLACVVLVVIAIRRIDTLSAAIHNAPEVREILDRPNGPLDFARLMEAEERVRARVAPSLRFWRMLIPVGVILGGVALVLELVVFGFVLGARDIRAVTRWYVGAMSLVAVCVVATGLALLFAVLTKDGDGGGFRAIEAARVEMRAGVPGAAERLAAAERDARAVRDSVDRRLQIAFTLFVASIALGVHAILSVSIAFCVLVYKLWVQVQDGYAPVTPGKALGFLFIPFYNFYWMFVALPGVADQLNRCAASRGLRVEPANRGLLIAYCVLCLVALVPFLGILAAAANMFVAIVAFRSVGRVGAVLQDASEGAI